MNALRAAAVALLLSSSAHAAHYLIADVEDVIPASQHAALARAGVTNTAVLYERIVTRAGREAFARISGVTVADLTAWANFIDLMQLNGVGPTMVRVLNAAGIKDLAAFQAAKAPELLPRMRAANAGNRLSQVLPSEDVVAGWITAARAIKVRLEP